MVVLKGFGVLSVFLLHLASEWYNSAVIEFGFEFHSMWGWGICCYRVGVWAIGLLYSLLVESMMSRET
jgi:hypothetical protein